MSFSGRSVHSSGGGSQVGGRQSSYAPSVASFGGPTISEYVSNTPGRAGKEHKIDTSAERVSWLNKRKSELEANGGLTQVKPFAYANQSVVSFPHPF